MPRLLFFTGVTISLVVVYWRFNPENVVFFPKCPFQACTGLKCPGCGSQRAVHYLLHGDLLKAIKFNAILVFLIPYLAFGFLLGIVERLKEPWASIHKTLYGKVAAIISLIILILWWILRNMLTIEG
jgi:hypothetical protein